MSPPSTLGLHFARTSSTLADRLFFFIAAISASSFDERPEFFNLFSIVALFLFPEEKQKCDVLRPPAVDVEFVFPHDRLTEFVKPAAGWNHCSTFKAQNPAGD